MNWFGQTLDDGGGGGGALCFLKFIKILLKINHELS